MGEEVGGVLSGMTFSRWEATRDEDGRRGIMVCGFVGGCCLDGRGLTSSTLVVELTAGTGRGKEGCGGKEGAVERIQLVDGWGVSCYVWIWVVAWVR